MVLLIAKCESVVSFFRKKQMRRAYGKGTRALTRDPATWRRQPGWGGCWRVVNADDSQLAVSLIC